MNVVRVMSLKRLKAITQIGIGIIVLVISLLLVLSYYSQNVGSFTINLHHEMFTKGFSLSENIEFTKPTSHLAADSLFEAWPIGQVNDPAAFPPQIDLDMINFDGANNGRDYLMYSFYIKNAGQSAVSYSYSIDIISSLKGVEEAIRVAVVMVEDVETNAIDLANLTVYAKPQSFNGSNPGSPEPGTTPFFSENRVVFAPRVSFEVGQIDRFTIIIWLHGPDADTNDSIKEGSIKLSMRFNMID